MAFNSVLLGYTPIHCSAVIQGYKAAQIEPQKQILCTHKSVHKSCVRTVHTQISNLLIIWYLNLFVPLEHL